MRIVSIGGGPAGLYSAILLKKAFPQSDVTVHERNRPDDTFGWGVVFSKETLGTLEAADPESYAEIARRFSYWDDIETHFAGQRLKSTGHGFCGLSRRELLLVLHRRCQGLGIELLFEKELKRLSDAPKADLVLAVDGVNSAIREELSAHFRPKLDWRKCKFCWLGTTLPLSAFTFIFKPTPHGLFQVHAYPFDAKTSTFIVECREEVWKKAGLDRANEKETVAFCEALFKDELKGHRLLTNKSIWRTFPTITNERWHHENVVLMGDAAHTAHFSIGSGTKLAMEDAIALAEAFKAHGTNDVPRALAAYDAARRPDVARLQKTAQTSLEWFENSERYMGQAPEQLHFNLMTRSKRITYDNLRARDPKLVGELDGWFAKEQRGARRSNGTAAPPMFAPFKLRGLELSNRVVVSPMCQYSAVDGTPNDWHLVHLGSRAVGGAGLVIAEATAVSPEGRITPGCAGLYRPEHTSAWKRVVDFARAHSKAKMGIQLAHAGRKASCQRPWEGGKPLPQGGWPVLGPSALAFDAGHQTPVEVDERELERLKAAFVASARAADEAGFDLVEIHAAHGYLLSSFLSPLCNRRKDRYGGALENRARLLLEVFEAVRGVWPKDKPMSVRLSATDWLEPDGMTVDDAVEVSRMLKARGLDIVDVSSGGNVPQSRPVLGRMYQVPFAERIRHEAKLPVMAVGAISGWDHANTVVGAGRADLCAIARGHLSDPYLTHRAAQEYQVDAVAMAWPPQYLPVRPRLR